jgi:hypothetical protein
MVLGRKSIVCGTGPRVKKNAVGCARTAAAAEAAVQASMYQPVDRTAIDETQVASGIPAKEPLSESTAVLLLTVLCCILYGSAYGVYVLCLA